MSVIDGTSSIVHDKVPLIFKLPVVWKVDGARASRNNASLSKRSIAG